MSLRVLSSQPALGAACSTGLYAASLVVCDSTTVANRLCSSSCLYQQRVQRVVHGRGAALYIAIKVLGVWVDEGGRKREGTEDED